ncbi:hypothetical protein N7448_005659 [Penicillium atrosanguineum]|uniref:DNA repair protein RAD51 homolog 3 n=1 Tax=Penicillium atrosanguineum TaxID=1132637 RepID=A0A9W9TZS9_9EURO|nr:DNA damage-inducible protein 1 [Penicillium atrosanguineum]KAJ5137105.1 hypothetical protein N7448_005659 [Penicillium atrosanguineum]KAJ5293446.1 DNA damage-inducible protein 1 [Penicillium atrosanguineum]KAJ5302521.1 hypothetical protein N7476_009320 [Penicillium atrosanguineum]
MSINKDLGLDSQDTLPVVSISASQSLNASASAKLPISTGLARLDEALDDLDQGRAGILRGQVAEVFGPPGAGKTSFALNIAAQAIRDGGKVVWIDTGSPLPAHRLQAMTSNLDGVIHFRAHTLPHLLALLMRPPKGFPPEETSLIVIDSVSCLFPSYFPNAVELKERLTQGKITDKAQLQWLLNRKWNVASELATHLARLAARNIAVLAVNQTHTKIKGQPRATLHPVIAGGAWETNMQTRIVLYRDLPDARFAEVTKRGGKTIPIRTPELIVQFRIESDGLHEVEGKDEIKSPDPTPSRKRKAENEIADSQDEDSEGEYEWLEEASLDNN